jgi:uncharacterized protein (TIGR02677 family)
MEPAAKIRAFAYVSAEKAELYRTIMRVFMRAKERFALHLRPAEIVTELQKLKSVLSDGADTIDVELSQLCDWGNLEARPDTSDVSTVDDFLRRRYLYQLTVSGEAAEHAIQTYEEAILQPGELQSAALSDIRDLLSELASLATNETLDDAKIHRILITLTTRFEELTRRAQSFMGGLQRRIDLQGIDLEDFIAYKNRLLDYLERFIQELIVATAEIAGVISRIQSSQLSQILRVVAERDLADAVNKQAGDFEVVLEKWQRRWTGLHEWFISRNGSSSHAEVLRARARSAIPALLGAIASINDRRISRIDRANDLRTLARWFAETGSDAEAHRLWRAAFGLNPSRHLSTNEATVEALEAARVQGNTSWFDAPPMQVSVRLRATGFHAKRGRSGTIIDRSDGKARLATLAAEEAVQIEKAQNRLAGLGRIRLSGIGLLDRAEFDLFLDLLGEALAMKPSVNEAVETVSSNGLLRITMEPILDTDDSPARAIIPTEDGQLSGPDHFVTIEHVFSQTTRTNLANHLTVNRA